MIAHLEEKEPQIRTAYGISSPNAIVFTEKQELIANVNSCLSIRGKNPKEFKEKLIKLIEEYE